MQMQAQKLINEIETIKISLIKIETTLIEMEKPSKDDAEAVGLAKEEYKNGKAVPFN